MPNEDLEANWTSAPAEAAGSSNTASTLMTRTQGKQFVKFVKCLHEPTLSQKLQNGENPNYLHKSFLPSERESAKKGFDEKVQVRDDQSDQLNYTIQVSDEKLWAFSEITVSPPTGIRSQEDIEEYSTYRSFEDLDDYFHIDENEDSYNHCNDSVERVKENIEFFF
jgi:hypothetical protein